ncbi:DNA internalization-related competence protein ComEC/Rec2 [Desulfomicrobium sp. ZS1]|uniref:DNA internalization-related competence protein ComEC/Rec2 n=1 Tax=Desulfomicrobium sp. ZS1 TaxID=2952228 RepID=UPI0020B19D48|nr:DNA internalization-related competence protein ComEC/Rec2 [Desulfomicrobium sp. ZS1]UTF48732.1 DNA internalization-related competence protein ComEC/Rec2 [Desulfomicrobium sp. ZS1]
MRFVTLPAQEVHQTRIKGPITPLPWQLGVLGYLGGLLAWAHALSVVILCAVTALALVRRGRTLALMALCFGLGLVAGMPAGEEDRTPGWNAQTRIRAVVDEVRTYPGRRIGVFVRDVVALDTNATLPGRLLWTWSDPPFVPEIGRKFEAELRIRVLRSRANFGLSSTEEYWNRKDIRHRAYSRGDVPVIWGEGKPCLRAGLLELTGTLVPATPGGAAVRALLFGDRFLLEPGFMDRIRRAGLSHSLALSGLHLALVASFGLGLARVSSRLYPRLLLVLPRRKLAVLLALPPVITYLWLGDFSPSLLRAFLMLAAVAAHLFIGSRSHPQDSLFAAMAVLVVSDPASVHDLSLQLSVLAVGGLVLFMPAATALLAPLRERGALWRPIHGLLTLLAVTCCANLFILPIQILYFSEVTAHLWLNLLWLPVLSLTVLPLSFLGLAVSLCCPFLAEGCFFAAAWGVDALDQFLVLLDGVGSLASTPVLRPSGVQVAGYAVVLVAGSVLLTAERLRARELFFLGVGLVLLAAPSMWQEGRPWRDEVEMTVLDTGMSQAVYVRGRTGRTVLVDGGGGWSADYDPGRAVVGPALTWMHPPRVDGVLLSHVHADHLRGLFYILDVFDVGWFGWSGLVDSSNDSVRLVARLEQNPWPVRLLRAGDTVVIEPGLRLEVLHPAASEKGISGNDTSLALRLVWRGRGLALLPGDLEKRALVQVMNGNATLAAEVLVLPHHGSKSSLLPRFYNMVGAIWAVAACGPGNRFGFPHPSVVGVCERAGLTVLTTAEHGALKFCWRGEDAVRVESARYGVPDRD